jgi:hypothetical protein
MAVTYNTTSFAISYIYIATNGGTVFSENLYNQSSFDYFSDSAVIGDCIYFGVYRKGGFSGINFNVGTSIVADAITIVWEYSTPSGWSELVNFEDNTNTFTTTGSNSLRFGLHQDWYSRTVVNGIYAFWIRARIKAVTNITEGGANTTNTITLLDGICKIDGYTDGSPCRLSTIYNYLNTNYPYLGITKDDNDFHYDLSAVNLWVNSRLYVANESFFTGFSNRANAYSTDNRFTYLQLGDKIDENSGKNGAILIMKGAPNTYAVTFHANTKIYGSTVKSDYGIGYPFWVGEWIDSNIDNVNFSGGNATVTNCRYVDPGVFIARSFPSTFSNNTVILDGTRFAYFYDNDVTIPNLSIYFSSGIKYMMYFYYTISTPTFTFINPNPQLPGINTTNKIVYRTQGTPNSSFTKVWYYDISESTYTDYTTEFSNTTVDNAPVSGAIGDIYYFAPGTGTWWNMHIGITSNLTVNNNTYVWEFYYSGSWQELDVWDNTNKFIGDGELWLGKQISSSGTSLNINGYTARWFRMRITGTDATERNITQLKYCSETGASQWNIYEKYSLDLNVTDQDGVAIEDANITIKLDGGLVYTGVTDYRGDMVQQDIVSRHWYFDPLNSYSNYQQIKEDVKDVYELLVTKSGYQDYQDFFTMDEKRDLKISMIPPKYYNAKLTGVVSTVNITATI